MGYGRTLLAVLFLSLVGCKTIVVENGRVPKEYLKEVKELEGRYIGSFEGKRAEVALILRGDQPILKYIDQGANDILGADCQSQIGLLRSVIVENRNGRESFGQMDFDFNPGVCTQVQGRQLSVRLIKKTQFEIRILDYTVIEDECDPRFPPPYDGHRCGTHEVPVYREGFFTKYR